MAADESKFRTGVQARHTERTSGATRSPVAPDSMLQQLPAFLRPAQSPVNLAVVRIICCTTALLWFRPDALVARATVDAPMIPPTISGELLLALPRSDALVTVASGLLTAGLVSGIVGWRTRTALFTASVTSWYVVGLAQSFGKVDHNHHLLWALLVLAVSPCADALSVDAARRRRPANHPAYGFPVRALWLVFGLAYFFAGLWKVSAAGIEWAVSDNLRDIIWGERLARGGFEPLIDIAGAPALYRTAGLSALMFELSFVFLVFTRARPLAVAMGVAFHMGIWATMGISFLSLVVMYGVFFDWTATVDRYSAAGQRLRRLPARLRPLAPARSRTGHLTTVVPLTLVIAVALAGADRELNGWPIASYPDFAYLAGDHVAMVSLRSAADTHTLERLTPIQQHRLLVRAVLMEDARDEVRGLVRKSALCDSLDVGQPVHIQVDRYRVTNDGLVPRQAPERVLLHRCGPPLRES